MEKEYHIPVLYKEVIDNLVINKNGVFVDCTLGGGGHSEGILKNLSEKGHLIAMDQDEEAIKFSKERLEKFKDKISIYRDNFSNIDTVVYMAGYDKVDGILMDIGVSSKQLDDGERGFSYRYNAKLDMRMDKRQELTAYKVVNEYPEEKLVEILYKYGEERFAKRIAHFIIEKRKEKPIETTFELSEVIKRGVKGKSKKHPSRKTFQAIRIEVNKELEVLEKTIDKSIDLLKKGGRLAIITFHSLEDRIVKEKFRNLENGCTCPPDFPICVCGFEPKVKVITRKPIIPNENEVEENFRAHSSKLRVVERV
ncbi:16S rRNA (cytosine(1402)-N(4))-methyltransferase RsmH [Haliovirga abyssi]|uniref:Ribosomal RNA small subunit methyltransferase H n=1 Tax=Haliovirga abyssi TaxID=2996794 RepID=A0AAU9E1G8_9FUSO|nr:16S rRNA (cytosine(1402)-N(4))-methyltransferase RsmH [Haliovirga abyssi]BDU50220.1 ribosomal RNA small subunit methyltransferase H [Haliovirga abyssi]